GICPGIDSRQALGAQLVLDRADHAGVVQLIVQFVSARPCVRLEPGEVGRPVEIIGHTLRQPCRPKHHHAGSHERCETHLLSSCCARSVRSLLYRCHPTCVAANGGGAACRACSCAPHLTSFRSSTK